MDLLTIIIVVAVVIGAAHLAVEEKYNTSSPALIIKQIASWVSFGILFSKDAVLTTVTETQRLNAEAKVELAKSEKSVDIGFVEGANDYKNSELRKAVLKRKKANQDQIRESEEVLTKMLTK